MFKVEGHRAFRGTMRITPKCQDVKPFELTGDWLYKPNGYWYGCGRSFGAEICTIVAVEAET